MNFLSIADMSKAEITELITKAGEIKKKPNNYSSALSGKSLLTIFETTSLRTKLSFEAAMTQLGGHAIDYHLAESTLGKKESMKEFAGCAARYVDGIAARIFDHSQLEEMAKYSSVPVINALTNAEHPCQILGDLMTMHEKCRRFTGLKLAYVGDGFNNVTHSLLLGCALVGIDVAVASPKGKAYEPAKGILLKSKQIAEKNGSSIRLTTKAADAAADADIIYTDSWMSYRVPKSQEKSRARKFRPYQVNEKLMRVTNNALFMHCLPAKRGNEVTDGVIDSKSSIIFDQAENRLHAQKALLLKLIR